MCRDYNGAKYDSHRFKDSFDKLDMASDYYLIDKHDREHYAYLSWRMNHSNASSNYQEMGEGYFVSAIIILEQCLNENRDRKGDAVIFPTLFNIEQAIELYIKAFIKLATENSIQMNFRIRSHDIRRLLNDFKTAISVCDDTIKNIALKDIAVVEKFIDLFFDKTTDCTYARYPYDTRADGHFYVKSDHNIIVDMEKLIEWVKAIFFVLDRNFINLLHHLNP